MTMALPASFLSEDQFTCSICLEVFNNPVSTPCGHSFCQGCISTYWDRGRGGNKVYQCPLCKESFQQRPELHINRTLKEITEQFKTMAPAEVPPQQRPGEMPGTIFAEMMTRFQQLPAPGVTNPNDPDGTRSFRHHEPPPPYSPPRRYTLSSTSESSPSMPLCPIHLRGLEYFCRIDNTCVCCVCVETGDHRGHSITPVKREWNIKKSQLGIAEVELKDLICVRERKIQEIYNNLREIQTAAERETEGTVSVFSKLISSLERCQAEFLEVLEMTKRAAENKAQALLRELQDEITELKQRSSVLSQLGLSQDYILFLKTFPALSTPPPVKDWSNVSMTSEFTSGTIVRTANQMMERFQEEMQRLPKACQQSLLDQSVPRPNPKTRKVQEYAADITLDANTAHPRLVISADRKQVYCGDRNQSVPDNPERFDRVVCALACQGFSSGRHYWEVEVGGKTDWDLGVASQSVNRKGKITVSPANGYWFLSLRDRTDFAFRTEPSTNLTVSLRPSRIGIYVDYNKGLVSFYNVEARVLIFTFTDVFSGTIHPFFSPCTNKSGQNEEPLIICPVAMPE